MFYPSRLGEESVVPKTRAHPVIRRKNIITRITEADYNLLLKAVGFLLASAVGFYIFEKDSWPGLSFSDSLWWSMVTAMTVGYGDIYPKTWQGRWLVAAPTIILGVSFLAHAFGIKQTEGKLEYVWA